MVEDLREEFVRDFVFPMFRAGAIYESQYLLGTSIARPLIAKRQVEIARAEGADAVAHGATGKGNDQVRFELTFAALAPELTVIAPWREWDFKGRADLVAYAEAQRIPITVTAEKPYSQRPQPPPRELRGRHPRGPVAGAVRRHVPADRRAGGRRPTAPRRSRSSSRRACRSR